MSVVLALAVGILVIVYWRAVLVLALVVLVALVVLGLVTAAHEMDVAPHPAAAMAVGAGSGECARRTSSELPKPGAAGRPCERHARPGITANTPS